MIKKETIDFLKKLEKNNNRDWFNANKDKYIAAQDNVIAFAGKMIGEIGRFDSSIADLDPKSCVFRIYRDVRFSKDKSPYKTNIGFYLSPGGRKSMSPGYYFHFQPKMYFIAAGKHMPDAQELLKIRNAIAKNFSEFKKIVESKAFRSRFGELHGDRLVKPPKGFDPEHPAIEYLKLKSFTAGLEYNEKDAASDKYPKMLAADAKAMYPLVRFLRKALG